MSAVSVDDVREEALGLLDGTPEGDGLDPIAVALIELALRASVTAMDMEGASEAARRALDAGATSDQVHETLVLVSALGVHTLMEGSRRVADILRERGDASLSEPLDEHRAALWDRHVGDDPYWQEMEREAPGFLDALVRLSPDAFEAFFVYCAVPWRGGALRAVTKELISLAVDGATTHRYLPGLRLHVRNAVALGAGRVAVLHALDLAAAAPSHPGLR